MKIVEDTRYEINDPNRYNVIHPEKDEDNNNEDKIIKASRMSNVTKDDLLDVFWKNGLVGVYNLGLKNILDYLNDN